LISGWDLYLSTVNVINVLQGGLVERLTLYTNRLPT
jgi:hypothetical protein